MVEKEETTTFSWPPLESDPAIFTKYCTNLGMPDYIKFEELISLDQELLCLVESKPLAIIVSFEKGKNKRVIKEESFLRSDAVPFYMLQEGSLDNACGIIAALHAIGNNLNSIFINEGSILHKFYELVQGKDPREISKILQDFNDFKKCHTKYAELGQSKLCKNQNEVKCHYVCFIHHDSNIIELDGGKGAPILISSGIINEEFLPSVVSEVNSRLNDGIITENLNVIYLTDI